MLTTSIVLLEAGNAIARRSYRHSLLELRDELVSNGNLIEPMADDFLLAWEAFARHDTGNAGIVELVSFEVMRRLGLTQAITNDEHFRIAGFETLMK